MNIIEINKRIKQRPPFQMVERVLDVVPGESVTALKNVSVNEPYFMGHFPDAPIMPGVLVIESAAQACSLAIEADGTDESTIYGQMHNLVDIRNVVKRAHMRRTEQAQIPYQRHTCQCERKVFS